MQQEFFEGKVNPRFAAWKIGSLNQAKCLTLTIRLMCLWIRAAYPPKVYDKLCSLIKFIVGLKLKGIINSITNNHVFNMIQRINQQLTEIQNVALKNLQHKNVFCFRSSKLPKKRLKKITFNSEATQ